MTQADMVLRFMQDTGSITPLDALREFCCMRLGARIYDLRRQGYAIRAATETRVNRYGKKVRYARYSMEE